MRSGAVMAHVKSSTLSRVEPSACSGKRAVRSTKSLSSQIKMEKIGVDYYPWEDTCLKAFVRLMALAATAPPLLNAAPETDAQ